MRFIAPLPHAAWFFGHGARIACQILCGFLMLSVVLLASAEEVEAKSRSKKKSAPLQNPKYAGLVIDADTGMVLYEDSADAQRHPASLTKMMTLYMTFDALRRQQLSLRQLMPVSKHAASMPQTNIALQPGDRLSVEDAIRSLVVRSANDAAVVLAEAIGRTESEFAAMMTNKAQQIGMNRTVFKNASGLPDERQVTSARDMATLGLALRRDFPEYYHFFSLNSFTYRGREYRGHNHVMREMSGVDGIKTGYVRMSGFNLVSSIRRDGYNLVGVVMGGRTARSRDDHMKELLVRSLRKVASLRQPGQGNTQVASSAPLPSEKPVASLASANTPSVNQLKVEPVSWQGQGASMTTGGSGGAWGIQVGAFSESREAFMAAVEAMNVAGKELRGSQINVTDPDAASQESRIYRARIANITEVQARRACKMLQARNSACFVYRENNS